MELVIDTSVLIAVISNEPSRKQALALSEGKRLIAPASVHWEIGNALAAMMRRKQIKEQQAVDCLEAYLQIPLQLLDVNLKKTLNHVGKLNIYAYDAYLITCAIENGAPLLTLDQGLRNAAISLGIHTPEL